MRLLKRCVYVWPFKNPGYGDFCPSNNASKLFTIFIGMIGIIILGILLGMLSEYLSDRQEQRIESRLQNARLKVMEQVRKNKQKWEVSDSYQ